jgi:hypothetical protein
MALQLLGIIFITIATPETAIRSASLPRGGAGASNQSRMAPVNDTPARAYLSRKEAADYLTENYFPISKYALARYAMSKIGPEARTRPGGGQCLYLKTALDKWAQAFPVGGENSRPKKRQRMTAGALSGAKR